MSRPDAEEMVNDLCNALVCYEQASSKQTKAAREIYHDAKKRVINELCKVPS